MTRKRILLQVDNPSRDLAGNAILAYWLIRKYNAEPIFVGTQNEITGLVRWKPHMIVMPHVRFERHRILMEYAKAQGTAVAVLPTEGLPKTDHLIPKTVLGLEEFRKDIDLVLAWGDYVTHYCKTNGVAPNAKIVTVGCPRFDVNTSAYDTFYPTKAAFIEKLGLTPGQPIVAWFSCTPYSNPTDTDEHFAGILNNPIRSTAIVGKDLDLMAMRRDNQRVYDYMMDLFLQLVRVHPQVNFLVKPHPFEPIEPYRKRVADLSPTLRVLDTRFDISEVIRYTDIQINWRCTTSLEGWLYTLNKKTISVLTPGVETSQCLVPMVEANECVVRPEEFLDRVSRYLNGETVRTELIDRRKAFIQNYTAFPGQAGEKAADAIMSFLSGRPEPARKWPNWSYILRKQLPHRLRTGRWTWMVRPEGDPKFISPDLIQRVIDKYNGLFSTTITPQTYRIEA